MKGMVLSASATCNWLMFRCWKRRIDGTKAQDLYDLGGILRSRRRCPVDEGGVGSVGLEEQSFPARLCQGLRGPEDRRRDDGPPRRRAAPTGRLGRRFQRACQASHG